MEHLCDLFFEFSNVDRVKMLLLLLESPENITGISKELGVTTQEVSRHVSRLSSIGLINKRVEGAYDVTPFGKLILKQVSSVEFVTKNRNYFMDHTLDGLPLEFVSRIGGLRDSYLVSDVMTLFQKIQEVCDEAEEYIWRITDRWLNIIYPNVQDAASRGVEYRRIEPNHVQMSPLVDIKPPIVPGEIRSLESVEVFMAISEKEVGGLAFPRISGEFDYIGFSSKDTKAKKWCKDLFQFYWNQGKAKIYSI